MFGIYIHWPFCLSKCPYCDFNSHVAARIDVAQWRAGYLKALRWFAARTQDETVGSVFFGGGTPSLMPPALVGDILDRIAQAWRLAPDVEVTLEANPTSAEQENFAGFARAGVNRLSLGAQALNDADLRALGRQHTAKEALQAWELAQKTFARTSLDLIYARPGQTPDAWRAELTQVLALGPEHVSAYQLTMEPETPFHHLHERGRLKLPDEETALEMFRLTRAMLAQGGLAAYEVSNHARAGAQCRHNLLYWRYGQYAGIGPGAHSRIGTPRRALAAERHPQRWLKAARQGTAGIVEDITLTPEEMASECLLMGLRLREGLPLARLRRVSGLEPDEGIVRELMAAGLLRMPRAGVIATTEQGEMVLEALIAQLADALRPAPAAS